MWGCGGVKAYILINSYTHILNRDGVMDVETFNAAKMELEHYYLAHMINRKEYNIELKELRKERQDDRDRLLEPSKQTEPLPIKPRRLYPVHKMKLYRSRRKQVFFTGARNRKNSKSIIRRR